MVVHEGEGGGSNMPKNCPRGLWIPPILILEIQSEILSVERSELEQKFRISQRDIKRYY